jgi:hypothetical protein
LPMFAEVTDDQMIEVINLVRKFIGAPSV